MTVVCHDGVFYAHSDTGVVELGTGENDSLSLDLTIPLMVTGDLHIGNMNGTLELTLPGALPEALIVVTGMC